MLIALSLLVPFGARANYDGPMRYSVFWPCNGNAYFCAPQVLAEGTIEMSSAAKFLQFISDRTIHQHQLPSRPTVSFDSPGGSLLGGMILGRAIRAKGFNSNLASSYDQVDNKHKDGYITLREDVRCASSCVLAFAGGVNRSIGSSAKMGVHQFYGEQKEIGDAATQATGGCKNFCVNGQLAGNCCTSMELHLNDRHERIDRQPAG